MLSASQVFHHRLLYTICFLCAVITSYSLSQLGLLATLIVSGFLFCGILVWKDRRPKDFVIANYATRVFVSLIFALVFFVSYVVVRKVQPANHRAYNLAALAIWFALLGHRLWIKRDLKSRRVK